MKILVTGNMGYVGPLVVKQLRNAHPDATIIGFDTGYFGSCLTGSEVLPECAVDAQHFGDMRKFPIQILDGVEAVIHLAGISNDPVGNTFEAVTMDINHRSTIRLAEAAKMSGAKHFVFASSCSIYGSAEDTPRTEESTVNPLTAYAKSKVFAERDLKPLAEAGFAVTCLRFSTACGWSDRLRLDLVLNDFVAGAIVSRKITVLSDGSPWRPLINVRDMARAADWAIGRDPSDGGTYLIVNVGSRDWNYQVRDLAEAVAREIPGVGLSINTKAPPDKRSYKVSFDLFERLAPKHQPQVDLIASIRELECGLEAMRFADAEFRNSRFIRLKVLTDLQDRGRVDESLCWNRAS